VDQQLQRTGKDRNRPLLQTDDPRKTLEELMAHRDPLYQEVADLVMETDSKAVGAMVEEVIQELERLNLT
jgi:shikimate kinase